MEIEPDTDLFLRAVVRLAMDHLDDTGDGAVAPADGLIPVVLELLGGSSVGSFPADRMTGILRQLTSRGPLTWLEQKDQPADAGRIVDLARLPEVRLVHRLSVAEIEGHFLDVDPDLSVLARLADFDGGLHDRDGWPLTLRARLEPTGGPHRARRLLRRLAGRPGWLARFAPGEAVVLMARAGVIDIEGAGEPGEPDAAAIEEAATHLQAAFDRTSTHGHPQGLADLQVAGLVDGWFPLAGPGGSGVPFGDLVEPAGLEHSGADVGRPGGWDEYAQVVERISRHSRHLDHLTADEARLMADTLTAFEAWLADRTVPPPADLVARFTRLPQALACATEELRGLTDTGADIEGFAAALATSRSASNRSAQAVVDYLVSVGAGMDGRTADSVAALERALATDLIPARAAQADLLSERGDAAGALRVLGSIYELHERERELLRKRSGEPPHPVGRNEPCWCGSGRKFKQCHLNRTEVDRAVQVAWLVDKARTFVERYGPLHLLTDVVATASVRPTAALQVAAMDVVLFDEGWFDRFLEGRGDLLPAGDRELGRGWTAGQREGIFRVKAVAPEQVVLVADGRVGGIDAGESIRVERTGAFDGVETGAVVWCRLLPDGDRWWSAGVALRMESDEGATGLTAAREARNWAMVMALATEVGDDDVVDVRTGQPRISATMAWLLDEPGEGAVRDALAGAGAETELEADAEPEGFSQVFDDGETYWEVDGRALVATSTTRAAADRALALVAEVAPGAELDRVHVLPQRVVMARHHAQDLLVGMGIGADDGLDDDDEYDDYDEEYDEDQEDEQPDDA